MSDDASLRRDLEWLHTPDCSCPYEWKGLGILYGVSMGKGWVRMSTDPNCRHHGVDAPTPEGP